MTQNKYVFQSLFIVALAFLIRSAWICDDAFITLRTVDNFINGYGLTWNVAERVQTFTHPLWMMMMSISYFFIRNGFFAIIFLSLAVSTVTLYIFQNYFVNDLWGLVVGTLALLFSKSFVDYSTSGLENPLSHLILLLFTLLLLKQEQSSPRTFLLLSLLTGLGMANRMDLILIFLPPLLYYFLQYQRSMRGLGLLALGFLPFVLWSIFSIIYYGFIFPNTFYAKLNLGISHIVLMRQGVMYYLNSLAWDPITLVMIGIATLVALVSSNWKVRSLAIGSLLYLAYIVYIGGDYMSGRFFSALFLVSVLLLIDQIKDIPLSQRVAIPAFILLFGFLSPHPTFSYFSHMLTAPVVTNAATEGGPYDVINYDLSGIADERLYYDSRTSLFAMSRAMDMPNSSWAEQGKRCQISCPDVKTSGLVGMFGFFAGPQTYILDIFAIGDPLLARIPMEKKIWRIGHFERPLVDGYLETLESGDNQIKNPYLAQYYDKLRKIIRGPVWSLERFKLIWEMNTGQNKDLIKQAFPKQ